jgi:hypothetical protein
MSSHTKVIDSTMQSNGGLPTRLSADLARISPSTLEQFLALHNEVTDAVLKRRQISVGTRSDFEWKFARGELVIRWSSPDGVSIESRQQLSVHGARWQEIRPYVSALIAFAIAALLLWHGKSIVEQLGLFIGRVFPAAGL